jgi:hypothetical protein
MGHRRERTAQASKPSTRDDGVSRRTIVAATVVTATLAVSRLADPAYGQGLNPDSAPDMLAFVLLSEALTGVDKLVLAPELSGSNPGTDPINIKNDYFRWINAKDSTSSFATMLAFVKRNPTPSAPDIITFVNTSNNDDIKFLARSIVLLWYLGSWYPPKNLKDQATAPKPALISSEGVEVVSPKAYTQGLIWQIAGAHPMGYSNLQFGYWSHNPSDPNDRKPLLAPPQSP